MINRKRLISWILIAAITCCTFGSVDKVNAKEITARSVGEDISSEASSETAESSSENSSETTEKTTEVTTEEKVVDPNLVATNLNPATAKVILIDPGHCKVHPGASGNGLREEVVVLDIAIACQNSLDEYGDVTVYMTREDGSCCTKLGLGDCLISRNNYAKMLSADSLISMHINAGRSSGANVLSAYQSGYNNRVTKETQALGKTILSKLSTIGISNRGLLLRKSESGNRYSNGKLADYYSIVRNGVLDDIPSIIIEHGYVTSSSDCNKFFKTKAKRKKVGKTDTKAIVSYYGLKKKVVSGTFKNTNGETYYTLSNSKKAAGWVKDDGKWYYFDETSGQMKKGFVTINKETFYLSPSTGEMVVGWFSVDGNKYLARGNGTLVMNQSYSDGIYTYLFDASGKQLKKGFRTLNGKTYYLNSKCRVQIGVKKVSGNYYLFDETGAMLFGYQKYQQKYYYLDSSTGVMARNKIKEIDNAQYYFNSKGVRKTGWIKYKGSKYYFATSTGAMVTGWKKIKGKYYYFSKTNGKMQKSKWIGKYYVNSKGVRTKKK